MVQKVELSCWRTRTINNMIFMDIHMPDVNGYEAAKMIRLFDSPHVKTIPIIAMTADVFNEDVKKCLAVGYVGKPLEIDKIMEKITKHCILADVQSSSSLQIFFQVLIGRKTNT